MATLGELAILIRSKNAGPFWITYDIMFSNSENFERVAGSQALTRSWFAATFGYDEADVILVTIPAALAIKISAPRKTVQGGIRELDMYSGQQYAPLVDLEIC